MLDEIFLGNTVQNWCISLLIILVAVAVNRLIVAFDKFLLKKFSHTRFSRLKILISSLERPVLLGMMLVAIWIAATRLNMGDGVRSAIYKAYMLLTVLNVTWAIVKFISILIDEFQSRTTNIDAKLLPFLKRGIMIILWTIGIVTAMNNAGLKVSTLLGALGVGGMAAALAAQDTIKNIFGGVTIFVDGHLHIGDHILFEGYEGFIEDINLRNTRIRMFDDRIVTVSNFKLMESSVTNVTTESRRRVLIKIGLTYNTPPQKMREAVAILKSIPQYVSEIDSDTVAVFSDFGDFSMNLTYIYFIRKPSDIRESISKVNFEILTRFNDASLDFAFPTQTVYLEKNAEPLPEKDIAQ
ncbi:MAG: mechanosensitive ion channel family protein [Prevotellaceae bacterium]|jgi:MscS family membrane protein|nr:mechanosensitive ion channel family protein [Prevotellaceae bacterium]